MVPFVREETLVHWILFHNSLLESLEYIEVLNICNAFMLIVSFACLGWEGLRESQLVEGLVDCY